MAAETEVRLKQAFELIEADQLDKAEELLKPLLQSDKDNPDVWWLYAHAVQNEDAARSALYTVLKLDKHYPEAADLLAQLETKSSSSISDLLPEAPLSEPSFLPSLEPDLEMAKSPRSSGLIKLAPKSTPLPDLLDEDDELDFEDDLPEPDDEGDEEAEESRGVRRPIFLVVLMAFLILLAVALVLVISKPFGKTDDAQPTVPPTAVAVMNATPQQAEAATPTTVVIVVDATPQQAEAATPTVETVTDLNPTPTSEQLQAATTVPSEIIVKTTRLGETAVMSICVENQSGTGLRQTLASTMNAIAKEATNYTDKAQAVGAELMDCQNNRVLRAIGVTITDAVNYASGTLDANSFQALWKPIG